MPPPLGKSKAAFTLLGLAASVVGVAAWFVITREADPSEPNEPAPQVDQEIQPAITTVEKEPILADRLSNIRLYLGIMYGCECPPPPSAGLIRVWAVAPEGWDDLTLLKVEVRALTMTRAVAIVLSPSQNVADNCIVFGSGVDEGFVGTLRVAQPEDLPRVALLLAQPPPSSDISIRLLVRDETGAESWVVVQPVEVCLAVS